MKKESGFTLIELLAVIVILAILLAIAIPAVSNYTTDSRKKLFISNARMYIEAARKDAVINGLPQDDNEQYVIKVSELEMEKDNKKSAYGNSWVDKKSYVVIKNIGGNSDQEYTYSIALEDDKGHCIDLTLEDDLDLSEVKRNQCSIEKLPDTGVETIMDLALTNTHELMTDADGNIHYYGKTPKNYVTFNGEKAGWRILGMYTVDGEKRLKLVRATSIGQYSLDNRNVSTGATTRFGINDWEKTRLVRLLNPDYEKDLINGSLFWNRSAGVCYTSQHNITKECDFSTTGLTKEAKNMIVMSTFNIGGNTTAEVTASEMASREKLKKWKGYVGVMNPSDYGYASDLSVCQQTLWNYSSDANCIGTNYLFDGGYHEWLLSYNSDTDYGGFYRSIAGAANHQIYACSVIDVRPVVYLDSSVVITGDGDGSINNPFTLSK